MERPVKTNPNKRILSDAEAARQAARKEAAREERRRIKRRKRMIKNVLLSLLAFVLILAAAFTGVLIYLQGQDGGYDDIAQCVQAPAMDYTSRYAFSAVDYTMSIRLDKNDIWWLLYQTGAIARMEQLDAVLAVNGMRLTRMGVSTEGSRLALDVEIAVAGNIRLPMTALCDISFTDTDIVVSVAELKLGNGWPGPLNWLCRRCDADPSGLTLSISKGVHPILSDIRDVRFADGYMVLVCGADRFICSEALSNMEAINELTLTGVENQALPVVKEHGVSTAALEKAFTSLQLLPDTYTAFRSDALALSDTAVFTDYLTGQYAVYLQRFLPALTLETVGAAHQELFGASAGRIELLEALATSLNTAYVRGTVSEPAPPQPEPTGEEEDEDEDGETGESQQPPLTAAPATAFVNNAVSGSPELTMEQLAGNSWSHYSGWISESDMRPVYIMGFPNTTVERPVAPTQTSEDGEEVPLLPVTVTTPERPIGLLIRMENGSFRLYYHHAALDSSNRVTYTLTHTDLSSDEGEGYMSAIYIPSVPYGGEAYMPNMEAVIELPPETAVSE